MTKWSGENYWRSGKGNNQPSWRNARTGEVRRTITSKASGYEQKGAHTYGARIISRRPLSQTVQKRLLLRNLTR